jgi:hypothetical protein
MAARVALLGDKDLSYVTHRELAAAVALLPAGVRGFQYTALEPPAHPFFLAALFQPQIGALAGRPLHPLIDAFCDAARGLVAR